MNTKDKKQHHTASRARTMEILWRLGKYLWQYKGLLILALILTVGSNLFSLIGPMLSGYAVDAIEPGAGKVIFSKVFFYAGWMVAFYIMSSVFTYVLRRIMITISRGVVKKMRQDVFERLMSLPVGYFDVHQSGDIISRISYDIDTVNTSLSQDVVQLLTTVITVAGAFSMMVVISPRLVLFFLFTVPLSVYITRFLTSHTRPLFRERAASLGRMNGFVEEMVTGQKTLKAYCQEENTIARFEEKNQEATESYYRAEYYGSIVGPMVNFVNNLSLALISVFGAVLFLKGQMSVGNISSFVLYSRKFSGPINEAANIISDLQSALAAAERVFKLLDEAPEAADAPDSIRLEETKGKVELSHVKFGYNPMHTIIHDLSFSVEPGKMIAIVGPTGAGKTTLINLLMRFYDVWDGTISVDGHDICSVTRESLRQSYAMVLQDTWLFAGTIHENLAYGSLDDMDEKTVRLKVQEAAKAAGIDGFIRRLPKGYDTVLTDEGTNISKGQKQLLTIARAMLLPARMVILDEATSNVDTRTEVKIQNAMHRLMENKTCFVIAHRLSTICNADWILVVNDGDVVQQGTHASLMAQEGIYRQMYMAQFE